jgi:pyruvate formate lyase activating enzyme
MLNEGTEHEYGVVLRIERSSIHDGDGFRTVVFLKGCPLQCQWCSTPESQAFEIEQAGTATYGKRMNVEQVLAEVRKDTAFYFHSGGGITLSGGEPLSQPEFAARLLDRAKQECINTAIETGFYTAPETVDRVLPYIDTAFVDIKLFDTDKHRCFCGVNNDLILSNLIRTNQWAGHIKLVIRIPIVPKVNDAPEELARIGAFCSALRHLHSVQLLPYHKLGSATYQKLGRNYLLSHIAPPTQEHMRTCREVVQKYVEHVI